MSSNATSTVPAREYDYRYVIATMKDDGSAAYRVEAFEDFHAEMGRKVATATKRCMANMCHRDLWSQVRIVTIIAPQDMFLGALLFALLNLGEEYVPLWTQSSGKSGTYYLVPKSVYARLGRAFDVTKDAEVFAAYVGLLFSDVTAEAVIEVPAVWGAPQHGEDGNGIISRSLWGSAHSAQVRMVALDDEGWPILLGKGVLTPVAALGSECFLNDTMVKQAHPSAKTVLIARTNVNDKPVKIPATFEIVQLLQNRPEVREWLKGRVQTSVAGLLDLVREGNIVALLRRLGALNVLDGQLLPAARNVLSALRANFPWCIELEERLGRVWVREISRTLIPSAGIKGWGYLALQHDRYGIVGIQLSSILEDIKATPERLAYWISRIRSFAFRIPSTSTENIVCFDRVLDNGKVHPDVMGWMAGDSDGDRIVVIKDRDVIRAFLCYGILFKAGMKPAKRRNTSPMSGDRQIDLAQQTLDDGIYVGALTMRQHNLIAEGRLDEAAYAGWLAQLSPMFLKHDLRDGRGRSLRAACRAELLKGGCGKPTWKVKQGLASECNSPREMYHLGIRSPKSLNDRLWNWAIQSIRVWNNANELKPLSLPSVAKVSYQANPGLVVSGADHHWRREIVSKWGKFWTGALAEGAGSDASNSEIYREMQAAGREAPVGQLVALLRWRPQRKGSTGFAIKWHVMGTRWEQVLGLRPEVKEVVAVKIHNAELDGIAEAAIAAVLGY